MSAPLTYEGTIAHVRTMLSVGATSAQLIEWARAEFTTDDAPDIDAIEAEARERMTAAAHDGLDAPTTTLAWSTICRLQRLADLYSRCLHTQDYKACLAVEKELVIAKGEREREAKVAARSDGRRR